MFAASARHRRLNVPDLFTPIELGAIFQISFIVVIDPPFRPVGYACLAVRATGRDSFTLNAIQQTACISSFPCGLSKVEGNASLFT
jgi:hypothetical protein